MATKKDVTVTIKAPNFDTIELLIRGTAPYVQNKFSAKARATMMATQEAGSTAKSKKVREPKDFDKLYRDAIHVSEDGWCGIPAPAFRNAMIDACRTVGYKMTHAKLAAFVLADGVDADDGTPLVRIMGEHERHDMYTRLPGTVDIRPRPMWKEWEATVRIRFDADMFKREDVVNLMMRVGMQVGIGEGRPNSKNSAGLGWGTFELVAK